MPEFLLQDWVMSADAEFGTTGFLSLTEMLIFDMVKVDKGNISKSRGGVYP